MNSQQNEKKSDWIAFIEKFAGSQIKVMFEKDENGNQLFNIINILETEIDISNKDKYGFLSIYFRNHDKRDKFLIHSGIDYIIEKTDKFENRNTNWSSEDYPCRLFFSDNGKILSFYDRKECKSKEEMFTSRITVFRNVVYAIIKLKIESAIQ